MLPTDLCYCLARLRQPQDADDLLFTEVTLAHVRPPDSIRALSEVSHILRRPFRGSGQYEFFNYSRLNTAFVELLQSYKVHELVGRPLASPEKASSWQDFSIDGHSVHIPYRVYIEEEPRTLEGDQLILNACLFTRHHSGYVRERYFLQLATLEKLPEWSYPYLFLSLSDYVPNIYSIIHDAGMHHLRSLAKVALQNPKQYKLAVKRAISFAAENGQHYTSSSAYKVLQAIAESNQQNIKQVLS